MADITAHVQELQDPAVRERLSKKCHDLPATAGAAEIARILVEIVSSRDSLKSGGQSRKFLLPVLRRYLRLSLAWATAIYRKIRPYKTKKFVDSLPAIWSDATTSDSLRTLINGSTRFEHVLAGSSPRYRQSREAIAQKAYGELVAFSNADSSAK
ncbi:MAG: hypothetical protein JW384_00645 [Nitrosomonadaceae bacterium]|nr:hypothetical protein [Nitrosomonadaceae bacterium]